MRKTPNQIRFDKTSEWGGGKAGWQCFVWGGVDGAVGNLLENLPMFPSGPHRR